MNEALHMQRIPPLGKTLAIDLDIILVLNITPGSMEDFEDIIFIVA